MFERYRIFRRKARRIFGESFDNWIGERLLSNHIGLNCGVLAPRAGMTYQESWIDALGLRSALGCSV